MLVKLNILFNSGISKEGYTETESTGTLDILRELIEKDNLEHSFSTIRFGKNEYGLIRINEIAAISVDASQTYTL
jgi:hypothetical protein